MHKKKIARIRRVARSRMKMRELGVLRLSGDAFVASHLCANYFS